MQSTVAFDAFPSSELKYRWDDSLFYIDCCLACPDATGGKLYINADSGGERAKLFLGSLATERASVSKSYPMTYLADGGILLDAITCFSVEMPEGEVYLSQRLDAPDPAIAGAVRALSGLSDRVDYREEAAFCIKKISEFIKTLPRAQLPALPKFSWHRVEDVRCTFSLTSFEHIVFDSAFVRAFANGGEWYISQTEDKNIFALCVGCPASYPHPMINVSDCAFFVESAGKKYFCVGIGLFDDGQYFCRLSDDKLFT